jgi:hypothetical protein
MEGLIRLPPNLVVSFFVVSYSSKSPSSNRCGIISMAVVGLESASLRRRRIAQAPQGLQYPVSRLSSRIPKLYDACRVSILSIARAQKLSALRVCRLEAFPCNMKQKMASGDRGGWYRDEIVGCADVDGECVIEDSLCDSGVGKYGVS